MSTRRVPAALHRELSEYASLLRALRTRDTLDVTKNLTKPSPFDLSHQPIDDSPSSDDPGSGTRSRSRSKSSRSKKIVRDHWTRWPLMLHDVLKPEWSLEYEIAVVASHVLRTNPSRLQNSFASMSLEEPEDDLMVLDMEHEEDDPDLPYFIHSLTEIITEYLSAIFGQLAALTPPRPASMQNRIEPLDWRAVIDAVVSLAHPEYTNPVVLRSVTRRLEAIYGPSPEGPSTTHRAIARAEQFVDSVDRDYHRHQSIFANIFDQASPPDKVSLIESPSAKGPQNFIESDQEDKAYYARRKQIAKGKRPERRTDISDTERPSRRSSRVSQDRSRGVLTGSASP